MTRHTILFLAANPSTTDRLALDREARAIRAELRSTSHRDRFEFETRWAAEPLDLLRELRALKPVVVHFSGHGGQNGLFFQAEDGSARLVSTAALAEAFGAAGTSVRLVVLSACYREEHADALLAQVDYVVGMGGSIHGDTARSFAIGFYGGLGECEPVTAAYRQGCAAMRLEGLPDGDCPQLKIRAGVSTAQPLLAKREPTTAAGPMRVAVMDFTDVGASGSLHALGRGLQSMITTDLAAAAAFELVEHARLQEIQGELKLQWRAKLHPETAVEIGRLVGASHLIGGSFTVLGEKMRIDCRLFAIESGRILLAEKIEGEKDAFFELEKALVQKLVASLGAKPTPKERAEMGKVHTADFEAFREFSEGITKFDEQRYDEAVAAMNEAARLDADFKLAHVTLARYEELIFKARAAIDTARQAEAELARLEADKEAKLGAEIVERLYRIAHQGSKQEQLVATLLLAQIYDDRVYAAGPFKTLREQGDNFAHKRMADSFYKMYWAVVAEVFPAAPPIPDCVSLPETLVGFDAEFAHAMDKVQRDASRTLNSTWLRNDSWWFLKRLHPDQRKAAAMLERVYQLGLKLSPPIEWKQSMQRLLADKFQQVLDLDRSTAFLLQWQQSVTDSKTFQEIAEQLDINREMTRVLQDANHKAELREFLRTIMPGRHVGLDAVREAYLGKLLSVDRVKKAAAPFIGEVLTKNAARSLVSARTWPCYGLDEYLLIGAEPTWALEGWSFLSTGPRSDLLHADEIRYCAGSTWRNGEAALLVTGAAPSDRFTIKLAVAFEPPIDWQPGNNDEFDALGKWAPEVRRPVVSVLFGLRNLEHEKRPLEGHAVRLTRGAVRLVKITAMSPKDRTLRDQPIAEWPTDLATPLELAVSVALDDKLVTVEVNGERWSAPSPPNAGGFLGLSFDGTGYAIVQGLQITRPWCSSQALGGPASRSCANAGRAP